MNNGLSWLASFDVDVEPGLRKSSIICTIGPKTNNVPMMNALRKAGMNIARMNFSHGSYEYHASVISNIRKSMEEMPGRPVAIALDTKGPEIRTGLMKGDQEVAFEAGHEMTFSTDEQYKEAGSGEVIYVDYKNLPKVIEVGKAIFVDDGIMSFEVTEILSDGVRVRALNAGKLASRKGVNLPKTDVDLPALSEKDISDLKFGVEQGVDMIFASFIRSGEDVRQIRKVLGEAGKNIKIISKIESFQGVNNFDEILSETDGVMIARGDLGIEIPVSRVFIAQKAMIAKCNLVGKPVICATQMLESMTYNPRPTRAEVSDVANAILDGADCVMLSGETAKGAFPIQAVEMQAHVAALAESVISYQALFNEMRALQEVPIDTSETIASSAVNAAYESGAKAIVVLSTSGNSARLVAKYRPHCPILTITREAQTARQIHLYRGCYPFVYPKRALTREEKLNGNLWQQDVDERIRWTIEQAIESDILNHGDAVIVLQGFKPGIGHTNALQIVHV
ncbi:pyruvate kinase [Basidiobolus meristosporus CBS 931.73]|uniref:Pyruvate kinase n=1 Tax=Basidiobolus meristosporus CBS 931.73 TaxID=1314790 RepID=A0A1Y1XRM2_9FUNG|nr:pyruvate kinase [Basidiobolus meristosporus CBS 931.73]|eukprot:ORX88383.1 pyruvate kinase [Basidiobolus meristosporus CBS 931.73]